MEIKTGKNAWWWWRAPSFYKPLEEQYGIKPEEWEECPDCNEKPRLWVFDNGKYAKCKCQDTYEEAAASGQSIWNYHKEHNGDMSNYSHNDLRDNWNKFAKEKSQQP